MPIGFLNAILLAGLAAVIVPPLIHWLTRRRFEIVPWAAMQFLDRGRRTRRRFIWDELLLMLLRMGLIALAVVALAAPVETGGWLSRFHPQPERAVVVVVDNSGSMAIGAASVRDWLSELLEQLGSIARVAVVRAGPAPSVLVPLTADHGAVRSAVQSLPPPRGGCNGPAAVALAQQLLATEATADRRIIVVSDGQRHGWADAAAAAKWNSNPSRAEIPVACVNLAPDRRPDVPRWALEPIRISRALALVGRPVSIRSELRQLGQGDLPPPKLRWVLDGDSVIPSGDGRGDTVATYRQSFTEPGSHAVSLLAIADDGREMDRQDLAFDVLPPPAVLIVDGDERSDGRHGVEFLREALAPARDPSPSVRVRVVSSRDFDPAMLASAPPGGNPRPSVVILADVARLSRSQASAVEEFVNQGGGVLVTLGERADSAAYLEWHRGGRGWLPAAVGTLDRAHDAASARSPKSADFIHPALLMFRQPGPGTLAEARFARWRQLTVPAGGTAATIAWLSGDAPLFVEGRFGRGRIIVSAVPLDDFGPSNVVELPAYAPLIHELIGYLSGAWAADANLLPGQAFVWTLPPRTPTDGWRLQPPVGPERPVAAVGGQITVTETWDAGIYKLTNAQAPVRWFVVMPDPGETDLTPLDDTDRARLAEWLPGLRWVATPAEALANAGAATATSLAGLAFVGVLALLGAELWLTRRRARAAAE